MRVRICNCHTGATAHRFHVPCRLRRNHGTYGRLRPPPSVSSPKGKSLKEKKRLPLPVALATEDGNDRSGHSLFRIHPRERALGVPQNHGSTRRTAEVFWHQIRIRPSKPYPKGSLDRKLICFLLVNAFHTRRDTMKHITSCIDHYVPEGFYLLYKRYLFAHASISDSAITLPTILLSERIQ